MTPLQSILDEIDANVFDPVVKNRVLKYLDAIPDNVVTIVYTSIGLSRNKESYMKRLNIEHGGERKVFNLKEIPK